MTFKQARAVAMVVGAGSALGWYAWNGGVSEPTPPKVEKTPSTRIKSHAPRPRTAFEPSKELEPTDYSVGTTAADRRDDGFRPVAARVDEPLGEPFHLTSGDQLGPRINDTPPIVIHTEDPAAKSKSGKTLSTEEVVARTEASVALVRGEKTFGSGFLIRRGILVTNAHVISQDPVDKIAVTFTSAPVKDRRPAVKGLLWEDARRDLAFLSVESNLPPLDIETAYKFRRGQEVTVIGNPGTGGGEILENAVSRGVMSTLMSHKNQTFFQMSVSINPGNSGGPVIGSEGRVVGVATLKNMLREGIAGCIPVADLAAALQRVETLPRDSMRKAGAIHDIRAAVNPVEELVRGPI